MGRIRRGERGERISTRKGAERSQGGKEKDPREEKAVGGKVGEREEKGEDLRGGKGLRGERGERISTGRGGKTS